MSVLNRFKYISHKYIRWISAVFLVSCVVFALGGIAILGEMNVAMGLLAAGVGLAFIGRWVHIPVVSGLTEIAMSILATGLGVVEAISGRNYQTWLPARGGQK